MSSRQGLVRNILSSYAGFVVNAAVAFVLSPFVVASLGEEACTTCHDSEDYCETCHQLDMPHSDDFVASHGADADRIGTGCLNCHRVDNCQACHGGHRDGAPQGHQLFEGVEYAPPAAPTAEPGTTLRR